MRTQTNWAFAVMAAAALALAGCGGGGSSSQTSLAGAPGGGSTTTQPAPMEPTLEERQAAQREAINTAVEAADTATTGLSASSTEADLTAADSAVMAANEAIAAGTDLPSSETEANTATVSAYADRIAAARMAIADAADEADKAKQEQMAKDGKALKAALGQTPLANLEPLTDGGPISVLTSSGLVVHMAGPDDTAVDGVASPRMATGASAGSLGGWAGTNYAHKNAGTGVSNSAIVYTNRAAPTVKPFATGASFGADQAAFDAAYTASTRTLDLGADPTSSTDIKGDGFPTAGTTAYTVDPVSGSVVIRGTYQGAPGNYRCSTGCSAQAGTGGAIDLGGAWVFVHDSGAMTSRPDANYLYFGWWLTKNKDDKPTSASAFTGVVGDVDGDVDLTNPSTLSGKASYSGHAAGKFAISDPLSGGDAGHFTADATLNATFGTGATNGLSGTLDNFMANEQSVPWSVTLFRRSWDTANSGQTEAIDDTNTAGVNEAATQTVWSIDGNSAAASGTWDAMMYDEKPGSAPSGDGSNVATSVTGTFQSHFGSTHTMVGAFGATKD